MRINEWDRLYVLVFFAWSLVAFVLLVVEWSETKHTAAAVGTREVLLTWVILSILGAGAILMIRWVERRFTKRSQYPYRIKR